MKLDARARQYAQALYAVADEIQAQKEVLTSLDLLVSLLRKDPLFRAFLLSKRMQNTEKAEIIKTGLGEYCHPLILQFLGTLKGGKIIQMLKTVAKAYRKEYETAMNILPVTAHTSAPLAEEEETALKQSLDEALGKVTDLGVEVDPSLLGGIKLRIGNRFLDASIRTRVDNLRRELLEA
jgi:F-type H+-transporting ATPase subunit delta